ncbi:MAG: ATP-binding protein [Chloroflexota bacterium]
MWYALTIPAQLPSLSVVTAFVWAIATDAGLNQRKAYRLRLAVDEIVTNIVEHGYATTTDPSCCLIHIFVEVEPDTISIMIEDAGLPYDITQEAPIVDVNAEPDARDPGGLGVYLVVRYIDDIRYDFVNGHNVNRLVMLRG